jgi:hypothetical protein
MLLYRGSTNSVAWTYIYVANFRITFIHVCMCMYIGQVAQYIDIDCSKSFEHKGELLLTWEYIRYQYFYSKFVDFNCSGVLNNNHTMRSVLS